MCCRTCRDTRYLLWIVPYFDGLASGWHQKGPKNSLALSLVFSFTCKTEDFLGALGRTRTCDLLIRSQTRSSTRGDTKGQGETKQRFYQGFITLEETGRDRERHGVVVPLWYERLRIRARG